MSKRDDSQWATDIAFHRSPLYHSKGMYRGPKIKRKRDQQTERSKSKQAKKKSRKQIQRKRNQQTKMSKGEQIQRNKERQIEKNRLKQIEKNRLQRIQRDRKKLKQVERDKERQKQIEKQRERQKQIENIPSEFKIPYEFKSPYEFKGINLTYEIAERILVQYTGSPYRPISDWAENVKSYHQKFGGLQPKRNLLNIAFIALIRLRKKGYASKDSIDNWKILPVER